MAKPELGEKRRCLSCETKFYDLNKEPPVCPKCNAVFELQTPEKPVPEAKPETKVEPVKDKTADKSDSNEPDTISLEDADEDDGDTVDGEDIPDDIPEINSDDDDDDDEGDNTFLENDDDDDDDMSDLVKVNKDDKDDT